LFLLRTWHTIKQGLAIPIAEKLHYEHGEEKRGRRGEGARGRKGDREIG
jgi:hypothetical protein